MLVVALATVVVSGLYWRTTVTIRSVENRLALAQVRWIERGVLDWAKVVLQADRNAWDSYKDVWATPIENTQLDETVTGGARVGEAGKPTSLRGVMLDAQSRLNLNALVDDTADAQALLAVQRLLDSLGLPQGLASVLQRRLQQGYDRVVQGRSIAATALALLRVDDLRYVPGFDDAVIALLRPYVILLPRGVAAPLNLNTADTLVVAAVTGLDAATAARLGLPQNREFRNLADVQMALGGVDVSARPVGVTSSFFLVDGLVRYDRVQAWTETLIQRTPAGVSILWQQRLF
jgi:general secretion pathway protein K